MKRLPWRRRRDRLARVSAWRPAGSGVHIRGHAIREEEGPLARFYCGLVYPRENLERAPGGVSCRTCLGIVLWEQDR